MSRRDKGKGKDKDLTYVPSRPAPPPPRPPRDRGEESITMDFGLARGAGAGAGAGASARHSILIGLDTGEGSSRDKGKQPEQQQQQRGLRRTRRASIGAGAAAAATQAVSSDDVQKVLDTAFSLDGKTVKLRDTAGHRYFNHSTGRPHREIVAAVQLAMQRHDLCSEEKRELFSVLRWDFACVACNRYKGVESYTDRTFIFWDDKEPATPKLRCGPCNSCDAAGRKAGKAGVGYRVVGP